MTTTAAATMYMSTPGVTPGGVGATVGSVEADGLVVGAVGVGPVVGGAVAVPVGLGPVVGGAV